MSRLNFRAGVDTPRPASAWAMVTLAGATLWITQQLDFWAVGAQAAALLISLWRRTDPYAWQTHPVALNLFMIGIVTGTILVALRGEPSTIALAHFAATTQGLQLLDARPRRTEFLLVALALFQVILAANLTDSVFFTPLIVGFLFATVWTLIVHTLRSEAIEAGVTRDVARALTPGLIRTTVLACLLAVAMAAVLFVLLPRLRGSVLTGPGRSAVVATAGFSDRVEFGELGRIRMDSRVVLRVETLEGRPPAPDQAYWRGLAFGNFDGTSWSVTPPDRVPVPGSVEGGVALSHRRMDANLVQRIVREPVAAGVLFVVGDPRGLQGTVRRLERDRSGGLYTAGQEDERIRYTVRSKRRSLGDDPLRTDRAVPPRHGGDHYLQLPERGRSSATCSPTASTRIRPLPPIPRPRCHRWSVSRWARWPAIVSTSPRPWCCSRGPAVCRHASSTASPEAVTTRSGASANCVAAMPTPGSRCTTSEPAGSATTPRPRICGPGPSRRTRSQFACRSSAAPSSSGGSSASSASTAPTRSVR